jgi:hypothetical protein
MFPPYLDPAMGLPGGLRVETFNKFLVSWAKCGDERGAERAEQLPFLTFSRSPIVFEDDNTLIY